MSGCTRKQFTSTLMTDIRIALSNKAMLSCRLPKMAGTALAEEPLPNSDRSQTFWAMSKNEFGRRHDLEPRRSVAA